MSKIIVKITKTLHLEFVYDNFNNHSKTRLLFKLNPKNSNWLYYNIEAKSLVKLIKSLKIIPKKVNGIINKNISKKSK